jgi:archaellum component FlaG (FlaF/FlaG flagellin family)
MFYRQILLNVQKFIISEIFIFIITIFINYSLSGMLAKVTRIKKF